MAADPARDAAAARLAAAEARRAMRRVAAEALILSDSGEQVIAGVRAREHLGQLAPRSGPLVRRFFALRDQLPPRYDDPDAERLRALLDAILHHHALLLTMALDLLAMEWRSEALSRQLDALDGLGAPARWLEEVYAELTAEDGPSPVDDPGPRSDVRPT